MLTALAVTLLTIATAAPTPVAPATASTGGAFSKSGATTLAMAVPTPGALALMSMGGLALIRARRVKR